MRFMDVISESRRAIAANKVRSGLTTLGIVFGFYPARRAAGLNPIQALRYE